MRRTMIAATLAPLMATGAFGQQTEREASQTMRRIAIADIWAMAHIASDKCPGVHIIKGSIRAITDEAGITEDEVAYGGQFSSLVFLGLASAQSDYDRDPIAWCARIWQLLGPDHPPTITHTLLTKD
jgi:hypothetical protein